MTILFYVALPPASHHSSSNNCLHLVCSQDSVSLFLPSSLPEMTFQSHFPYLGVQSDLSFMSQFLYCFDCDVYKGIRIHMVPASKAFSVRTSSVTIIQCLQINWYTLLICKHSRSISSKVKTIGKIDKH